MQTETRDILSRLVDKKDSEGSNSGSHHEEKKTFEEKIFSKTRPHKRKHEFKYFPMPTMPKFLEHRVE